MSPASCRTERVVQIDGLNCVGSGSPLVEAGAGCATMFQWAKEKGVISQRVMRIKIESFFLAVSQGRDKSKKKYIRGRSGGWISGPVGNYSRIGGLAGI